MSKQGRQKKESPAGRNLPARDSFDALYDTPAPLALSLRRGLAFQKFRINSMTKAELQPKWRALVPRPVLES